MSRRQKCVCTICIEMKDKPYTKCHHCGIIFSRKKADKLYCTDKCQATSMIKRGLVKKYRANSAEKAAISAKKRHSTLKGRLYTLKSVLRWQKRNPEKIKAHKAVGRALKKGLIIKPNICQIDGCSESGLLHAHHYNGYSKDNWLKILFICPKHHKLIHAQNVA